MTKDEALQDLRKAVDVARQQGADDAEIIAAVKANPKAEIDRTADAIVEALNSKPADDLPDYPFPQNPLKP